MGEHLRCWHGRVIGCEDCAATARRELATARAALSTMHRRAQRAESIIAQSGIVEARPQGPEGRSLGRALANYAAATAEEERDALAATLATVEAIGWRAIVSRDAWRAAAGIFQADARDACRAWEQQCEEQRLRANAAEAERDEAQRERAQEQEWRAHEKARAEKAEAALAGAEKKIAALHLAIAALAEVEQESNEALEKLGIVGEIKGFPPISLMMTSTGELLARVATAERARAEAEAGASPMREALEFSRIVIGDLTRYPPCACQRARGDFCPACCVAENANALAARALASTAGTAALAEIEAGRALAEAVDEPYYDRDDEPTCHACGGGWLSGKPEIHETDCKLVAWRAARARTPKEPT